MELLNYVNWIIGQEYNKTYKGRFGGAWSYGVNCGSRGSSFAYAPLSLYADYGARLNPEGEGQEVSNTYRCLLGGDWDNGASCGSRGSYFNAAPMDLASHIGARFY